MMTFDLRYLKRINGYVADVMSEWIFNKFWKVETDFN
jgi:hypothetical protein